MLNSEEQKNLRRNYIANVMEGGFFGAGTGFASFGTVLPLFVSTFTQSAVLIGLISSLHVLCWQLPQLLTANHVARQARFKPMTMLMTIFERLPFLGLGLIAIFSAQLGVVPTLILTYLMLICQGLGAGFTANAWQNMIGRVIPADYLAMFFGIQSSAANLFSAGTAFLAGLVLERWTYPNNYAACFLFAFGLLICSFVVLSFTRESPRENVITKAEQIPLWDTILRILRTDSNFNWFIFSRAIAQFGMMAFGFYTVYTVRYLGASVLTMGVITTLQFITNVVANVAMGWLADRWSRKGVMCLGAFSIFLSALLAWYAPSVGWMYPVIIISGIANTAFWTVVMAMTLQFGSEHDRPAYVGMSNTLIAPATVVAPLFGGWLADTAGYQATFLCAALVGLVAFGSFLFFLKEPKKGLQV